MRTLKKRSEIRKTRKSRAAGGGILDKWLARYEKIKQGLNQGSSPSADIVWIMDYANIIHTLHDGIGRGGGYEKVKQVFTSFVLKNPGVIIVAKPVFIDGQDYSVAAVLDQIRPAKMPTIIEIHYKESTKSNLDDLIFLWIAFVEFASGANPVLLTNDRQDFRKNLFGLTPTEIRLKNSRTILQWKQGKSLPASPEFMGWLRGVFRHNSRNTAGLECNIMQTVEKMTGIPTQAEITDIALRETKECTQGVGLIDKDGQIREEYYLYTCFKFMQEKICHDAFCSMTREQILELFGTTERG